MKSKKAEALQSYLEKRYDIPFYIRERASNGEISYFIAPANEMQSLFEITVTFRNEIRVVIEIRPQKFAADMISDMFNSSREKRELFLKTVLLIIEKGCRCEMDINGNRHKEFNDSLWAEIWNTFYIRLTKAPVGEEDKPFEDLKLAKEWADITVCLMLSLLNVEKLEDNLTGYHEGGKKKVTATRYERNPVNRKLCIEHNGYRCKICGFDFAEKYGQIGKGFIHVHHIVPVSSMGEGYCINPAEDLIPVCPNCHAMLHTENPPLSPEKLMKIIKQAEGENCEKISTD